MGEHSIAPTSDSAPNPARAPAAKPPRRSARTAAQGTAPRDAAPSAQPGATTSAAQPPLADLSREELARALRAMASELERDPALARRISDAMRDLTVPRTSSRAKGTSAPSSAAKDADTPRADTPRADATPKRTGRAFKPRVVAGMSPDLGTGIPDPFALRARLGDAGLRATLAELRIGTLRAMVREHGLDPTGAALHGTDADRLRALIVERTARG